MKKLISLVLLLMSLSVFGTCIEITEDIQLDDDNESCFIITEEDITFDCNGYSICEDVGDTCITVNAKDVKILDCIIEGDSSKTAIRINKNGVQIEDITINNAKTGVYINNAEECEISNVEIQTSDTGIYIKNSKDINIEDIEMYNTDSGVSISSSSGISLEDVFYENDGGMFFYIRFFVEDKEGDPIEDAEITLEATEGSDPFDGEETDEAGYTNWKSVMVVFYDNGDEIENLFNLTVEYGEEEYFEENFDILKTKTYIIELDVDVEEQEELAQLGESCIYNTDCVSGYCCMQGDYRFTCRAGPTFCLAYECTKDSDCDDDEICDNNKCVEIEGDCGYAKNHKWIVYECCGDINCDDEEECKNNECVKVKCDCGGVKNHKCTAECCSANDCPSEYKCVDMVCLAGNACSSDGECKNIEYCKNGFCEEITGTCGYAFNHRWIKYECCSDTECIEGKICKDNVCIQNEENKGGICVSAFIVLSTFIFGLFIKKSN